MVQQYDFSIWIGNSGLPKNPNGLEVQFQVPKLDSTGLDGLTLQPLDLTGSSFVFEVAGLVDAGGKPVAFRKSSDTGGVLIDAIKGRVTVPLSVADSRLFALGRRMKYELFQRIGAKQITKLAGFISVSGGTNDDMGALSSVVAPSATGGINHQGQLITQNYTAQINDAILEVDSSANAVTIQLPANAPWSTPYTISWVAGTHPVTITSTNTSLIPIQGDDGVLAPSVTIPVLQDVRNFYLSTNFYKQR